MADLIQEVQRTGVMNKGEELLLVIHFPLPGKRQQITGEEVDRSIARMRAMIKKCQAEIEFANVDQKPHEEATQLMESAQAELDALLELKRKIPVAVIEEPLIEP